MSIVVLMRYFGGGRTIYESFVDAVDTLKRRPMLSKFLYEGIMEWTKLKTPEYNEAGGQGR